jgi:hypothetical protein
MAAGQVGPSNEPADRAALLGTLDTINDRTQLDVPANSEVRV